jgi:hypothetical protein
MLRFPVYFLSYACQVDFRWSVQSFTDYILSIQRHMHSDLNGGMKRDLLRAIQKRESFV